MVLASSFLTLIIGVLSYLISGIVFGYTGWNLPILSGFEVVAGSLDLSNVHVVPQWEYILMVYGFGWFVSVIIGTIGILISVFIRSTPAGMGIILASLIAGGILSGFATEWEGAKYLFIVNLQITDYLNGTPKLIEGLTFDFAILNLFLWAVISFIIAFFAFTKQDMVG
jgi:ABC-2 type transport system permease protein